VFPFVKKECYDTKVVKLLQLILSGKWLENCCN
jgi:hypothetical protein